MHFYPSNSLTFPCGDMVGSFFFLFSFINSLYTHRLISKFKEPIFESTHFPLTLARYLSTIRIILKYILVNKSAFFEKKKPDIRLNKYSCFTCLIHT